MTMTFFFSRVPLNVLVAYEIYFEEFCSLSQKKGIRNVKYFKSIMAVYSPYDKVKGMTSVDPRPSHQSNTCSLNKKDAHM